MTRTHWLVFAIGLAAVACNDRDADDPGAEISADGDGDGDDGDDGDDDDAVADGDAPLDALSDEFDDPATLSSWTRREEAENTDAQYTMLDVHTAVPDRLVLVPKTSGWFGDFDGPFLYKMVSGDFLVETAVRATSLADRTTPPGEDYNSAGLLVRNPDHGPGRESWLMLNVGRQAGNLATETKTTQSSMSELELFDGAPDGRLRICRRGSTFVMLRRLVGESEFSEVRRYERSDLPATLQVGVITNAWNALGPEPDFGRSPDLWAEWDYVRFSRPRTEDDCRAD